jgi:DNA-binding XRE family transcriptional regulator
MTKATFLDDATINVVAHDGEIFTFKTLPVPKNQQQEITSLLAFHFDENFSADKTNMVYRVSMKMFGTGFFYHYWDSDRNEERERIGSRIRQLRENKSMEAKVLAKLSNIDAANFSRIEQGRYSVGLDILSRIAKTLGVKVDLV